MCVCVSERSRLSTSGSGSIVNRECERTIVRAASERAIPRDIRKSPLFYLSFHFYNTSIYTYAERTLKSPGDVSTFTPLNDQSLRDDFRRDFHYRRRRTYERVHRGKFPMPTATRLPSFSKPLNLDDYVIRRSGRQRRSGGPNNFPFSQVPPTRCCSGHRSCIFPHSAESS